MVEAALNRQGVTFGSHSLELRLSDLFEALRLFITNTGSIARLEVGGELDLATVGALRDHLDLLVESGTGDVDVDMALVTFCDATALSALVAAHHQLASVDRRLRVVGASPRVVRLLQLTALDMLLADAVVTGVDGRVGGATATTADKTPRRPHHHRTRLTTRPSRRSSR